MTSVDENVGKKDTYPLLLGVAAAMEVIMVASQHNIAVSLLGTYPKDSKYDRDTCTSMFMTSLLTRATK